tara:strand:- start:124 stop:438 length:315 start_codon:yes stop_codon:yes gene_type:complete
MKMYKLYYSNESDFSEVFELKKFIRRNNLESKISRYPYINGSDALSQLSQFTVMYSQQLADQNIILPLKLRYTLLVVEDSEDVRNVDFVKGRADIESYLQTNLL